MSGAAGARVISLIATHPDAADLVGRFLERTGEVSAHRRIGGFLRRDFEGDAARDAVAQSVAVEEVERLNAIEDPRERARAAQAVLDAVDARITDERARRDRALVVLLQPYARALADYERHRSRTTFRDAMDGEWKISPTAALARVSVSLCRRILAEATGVPNLTPDDAEAQAAASGRYIVDLGILRDTIREDVRDKVVKMLLRTEPNADIARMLGLTTARIAQIGATRWAV